VTFFNLVSSSNGVENRPLLDLACPEHSRRARR